MRYQPEIKEEAVNLRKTQGLTLSELAETLRVSKTTVYYWVKGVPMAKVTSPEIEAVRLQRLRAAQLAGNAAMRAKYAARRQEAYDAALQTAHELVQDRDIRDFVVLYLAEGYRKSKNRVSLGNSNPHIVKVAHNCMRRLSTNPHFYYSFQYHADQDPIQLSRFWAAYLGIAPEQIKSIPKTNSGQLKGRRFACAYGVFQIQVGDTYFRAR